MKKRLRLFAPDGSEHTEQAWKAHEKVREAMLRDKFGRLVTDRN